MCLLLTTSFIRIAGLCGLVAHKLGARVCILTEGNEEVTRILKQNVATTNAKSGQQEGILDAELLLWGHDLDAFEERFPYKYDVIMGSDIVYSSSLV